jgi:tetratricopeptide (TPR) repeat protein
MGKNDQALSLINELINKSPNFEGWRVMRAQINIDLKQLNMAKNDLDWLINKNVENYTYFQLLAHYHLLTNNSDNYNLAISKVLSLLNTEIEKNPENIELYFQRASTLQNLKKLSEALSDYAHIQSIFPMNYEALKQTAKIKLMQQVWNEAISIYNVLLANYPEEEEFYNNSALAYINMNNYQLASENFKKAIKLNPDNVDAHFNLARLNKTMGLNAESEKEIDQIRKILERKQKLKQLNKNDKELLKIINEERF